MYLLENAEEIYRENPGAVSIPRLEERHNLRAGEVVKIGLIPENSEQSERVWARVERVTQTGKVIGVLLESPASVPGLQSGFHIEFEPEHVHEIYVDEHDYRYFDSSKLAMVSLQILENNSWPGRLLRIPPPEEQYSGWFILQGDEDRFFMRDLNNFRPFTLADCISRVASLSQILWAEAGSDWKWDTDNYEYRVNKLPKLGPV